MNYASQDVVSSKVVAPALYESLPVYMRLACQPIRRFLEDPAVIEVMVNRPGEIIIEAVGRPHMECYDAPELTHKVIASICHRVAGESGQAVNQTTPLLFATMPNGERFTAAMPPVTAQGSFCIRRQVVQDLTMEDYLRAGAFDNVRIFGFDHGEDSAPQQERLNEILRRNTPEAYAEFLIEAVKCRTTFLVSAGTGAGKTTFFNMLLKYIPDTERIVSGEDVRELKPPQFNYVPFLVSKGQQGIARVTMQDLIGLAMRYRPDRIFLQELIGKEAFSFLQVVNTGHPGSGSTIHANSVLRAFDRLAMMTLEAGMGMTLPEIYNYIKLMVPMAIQLHKMPGKRAVTEIYFQNYRR